jgi:hypothetical protein
MGICRRLGTAVLAVMVGSAGLVALSAAPASASGPYTSNILSSVNSARASHGLRPYTLRSDLSSVAYSWSKHMAASNSLSHNPRLTSQVTNWRFVGENVGYASDWKTVMAAFMASPGHRANILDSDFTEIGIGVVATSDRIWVTQVFREPLRSTATSTRTTTTTRTSTTRTHTSTSTQSHPTAVRRVTARPPTAAQLLASRIHASAARQARTPRDPIGAAIGFASTMRSVAR